MLSVDFVMRFFHVFLSVEDQPTAYAGSILPHFLKKETVRDIIIRKDNLRTVAPAEIIPQKFTELSPDQFIRDYVVEIFPAPKNEMRRKP